MAACFEAYGLEKSVKRRGSWIPALDILVYYILYRCHAATII